MIEVQPWTRKHRSELEHWPSEPNLLLPAFLLRSQDEPYDVEPISFAVCYQGALIGRFTYRVNGHRIAFVGLVLSPAVRGRRLGRSAMAGSLVRLGQLGIASAYCSVAMANTPSYHMLLSSSFYMSSLEWRLLPDSFNFSSLVGLDEKYYRLGDAPAMLYAVMFVSIDFYMYTEVSG